MEANAAHDLFENDFKQAGSDPLFTYFGYKSLDEFIDAEHLRSLDSSITEKINRHIRTRREDHF
jgi:hypothetical protein